MEFFYRINSNAAPFFSDTSDGFIEAEDADDAISKVLATYSHPAGAYAMAIYTSADSYHRGATPIRKWRSEAAAKAWHGEDGL